MIATPQETGPGVSPTMLQGIVASICDRPGDTDAQREARSRDVVDAVQGFEPRDPVELMLAGMAVIHAHLIQDSVRDLVREQDDRLRARGKSTIVALDRAMVGFLKEFRIARKRASLPSDADEHRPEDAPTSDTGQVTTAAKAGAKAAKPNAPSVVRASVRNPGPPPGPPVPLLPPLGRSEMSTAAMMAVISPSAMPLRPFAVARPAVVSPTGNGTRSSASRDVADQLPAQSSRVLETTTSERFPRTTGQSP
jgi:hypothetical protein